MLQEVKDNGLLSKPVVHTETILTQVYTTDCINLKITVYIFNVPEKNDCHRCDRYKLCDALKNLLVVDF